MTRTELISKAFRLMTTKDWESEQVNTCKCWVIYSPDRSMAIIKSYRIATAVYSFKSRTMYVFDFYTHTTQLHIRKAAKMLGAIEIRYLYQRSDNIIVHSSHSGNILIKRTPKECKYIIKYDWMMYIEVDWNY